MHRAVLLSFALVSLTRCPSPAVAALVASSRSCLPVAPPSLTSSIEVLGPEHGCPEAFACFDLDGGTRLLRYVESLEQYGREAWLRCGVVLDGGS